MVTAAIFVVVFSLLAYAVVKFRKKSARRRARARAGLRKHSAGTRLDGDSDSHCRGPVPGDGARDRQHPERRPASNAIEVTVIGHQFWWEYRYPSLKVVTANELHIPVSDPAHPTPTFLTLLSADTDHSFWVPRLAGKTDLIPNHPNSMWMDPHETGLYLGQCAQYCGTQHAKMLLRVYVQTREEFDRWIQEQSQPAHDRRRRFRGAADLRADRLHQLPRRGGHRGNGTLRSRSDPPDEPRHHRLRRGAEHAGKSAALDSGSQRHQTRIQNAGHGIERSGTERGDRISGDSSLMSTESIAWPVPEAAPRPLVDQLHQWVTTVDHKRLGILYIVYALVFLVIGGVEATIMRIQLIRPHNDFVSPEVFNRMFTMHGTTMIFFVAMPLVFGFANYLVPLMIGARDMAFPRLNAFSFWMTAFGGLLLYFSFVGGDGLYGAGNAPDVGWFAYAPLTSQTFSPGHSTDFWILSLLVSGFGSIGTAINIIATILCMRCPGMTLGKMPLLAWLNLTMAGLVILAVSPLTAAQVMLLVDRYLGGHFFDTQAGGSAVIWMHFFWIFGHPEVYVLVIPAFAFASEIIPVFLPQSDFRLPGHGGGNASASDLSA